MKHSKTFPTSEFKFFFLNSENFNPFNRSLQIVFNDRYITSDITSPMLGVGGVRFILMRSIDGFNGTNFLNVYSNLLEAYNLILTLTRCHL